MTTSARVRVDGKGFRLGAHKFHLRGVAYGPFAPNGEGEMFASPDATLRDLTQMGALGANLVRVYTVPPVWFLDLAQAHDLRVLIDVPWNKHGCFQESVATRMRLRDRFRQVARDCGKHPATLGISLVNELPPDVVRWSGVRAVESFLDDLADVVRQEAPECLCTFGNYPRTEFLRPRGLDFACFNLYLHDPRALRQYLARLQTLAGGRPLVLGEFGMDALREGEARQAALLGWTIEHGFRAGLAGMIAYSFTDEWFKDGCHIDDWQFGLTTRERRPRPGFAVVQQAYQVAPYFPPRREPLVSVVVASYNGGRTLRACLDSLGRLRYPAYEVILVDDGSTDDTPAIAAQYPQVRRLRHERNRGLSASRNTGIAAARGEIVAFTDDDCRVDEDWLHHLVAELTESDFVGVGGHNLAPADDSAVAAAVLVSPGGPAHVLLTDREAEHLPGCNLAFWKWALLEVECFDPVFHRAGDDVDLCWRLQQQGYRLGFSAAGFVWHARRSTVRGYLKQQHGYGEAEALLAAKHPEYFNLLGGSLWRGRIYATSPTALLTRRPLIYHGRFGAGWFQSLYVTGSSTLLMGATSLEYHVLVTLPLWVLSALLGWLLPLAVVSVLLSLGVCGAAAAQAELPRRKQPGWSRPLVGLLFALQPLVRGWARYQGRLFPPRVSLARQETLHSLSWKSAHEAPRELQFGESPTVGREAFLRAVLERLGQEGWHHRTDTGWGEWDLEVYGSRWSKLRLITVSEQTDQSQQRLRCRLETRWTLPAKLGFWLLAGAGLVTTAALGAQGIGALLPLVVPAAAAWGFARDQRNVRRVLAAFLEAVAESVGIQRLRQAAAPA